MALTYLKISQCKLLTVKPAQTHISLGSRGYEAMLKQNKKTVN